MAPSAVRQFVVLLVVVAQVIAGSSAAPGGVICWGGGGPGAEHAESDCSHIAGADHLRMPASVPAHAPEGESHDCLCIDVCAPIANLDRDSRTEFAPLAVMWRACWSEAAAPASADRRPAQRPPGPALSLRTVRLLI